MKAFSRKHLRVGLDKPLHGSMQLVSVGGRKITTRIADIRILNISTSGLKFTTTLRLPAEKELILELSFLLEGAMHCIRGYPVYLHGIEVNEFEYGFSFLEPGTQLLGALKRIFGKQLFRNHHQIMFVKPDEK